MAPSGRYYRCYRCKSKQYAPLTKDKLCAFCAEEIERKLNPEPPQVEEPVARTPAENRLMVARMRHA